MKYKASFLLLLTLVSINLFAVDQVDVYHCDMSMTDGRFVEFAISENSSGLDYSLKAIINNEEIKLRVKDVEEVAGYSVLYFVIPGMSEEFSIEYNLGFRNLMKEYAAGMWYTGTGNMPCELR